MLRPALLLSALPLALSLPLLAQDPPPARDPLPAQDPGRDPGKDPAPADPLAWIAAPGKVVLNGTPQVGWRVVQSSRAGQQVLVTRWAIVGETADAWRIEHASPVLQSLAQGSPELKEALMGLLVRKKDGVVTRAVVGVPGQAGRAIRVSEPDQGQPEEAPQESEERLVVPGGTFRARKAAHPAQGAAVWTGLEGAAREVVLKVEGPAPYELTRPPQELEHGGRKLCRFTWSNKTSLDLVEDPVVAAFFPAGGPGRGMWAMRGEGFEITVSEVGTDATPRLKWD